MATGTGGTFGADANAIGMTAQDIQVLVESLRRLSGDKGVVPYSFNGSKYKVAYENHRGDTTLTSIKPL
jgi:hypothetical protein